VNVTVRQANPADAPALFRAWQALRAYNASLDPRIIPAPVSETEFTAGLGELLRRPTACVFVAEREGRIVGFIRAGIEQNLPDRLPEQHASVGYLFAEGGRRTATVRGGARVGGPAGRHRPLRDDRTQQRRHGRGVLALARVCALHPAPLGATHAGACGVILHLVRHGETDHNSGGLTLGRADVPLNETGRAQAAALGARFADYPVGVIYTSPLSRAQDTARAVAGERDIPLYVRDQLIEMDVGETENITFQELRDRYPEFLRDWGGEHPEHARMPGGESLAEVAERVDPFLSDLRAITHDHVVVVTHNFVLKVILCRLLELELSAFRAFATDVAAFSTVVIRDGRISVRALNDRCHVVSLEH